MKININVKPTRRQIIIYLYWAIYEFIKYPKLRSNQTLWQHIVYSFYRLYTYDGWFDKARKIHNGQKQGK